MSVVTIANTPRQYDVDEYPDTCPVCHKGGTQISLGVGFMIREAGFRAIYRCSRNTCENVYFATYMTEGSNAVLLRLEPGVAEPYEVSDRIKAISPQFEAIVSQAHQADAMGLDLIAGPGYRKGLEFLVKDFLINSKYKTDPENQQVVRAEYLGKCIKKIESIAPQKLAERCTWLGNDETHYTARFPEYSLADLKALLRLTVREVDNELEVEEYLAMQSRA